MKVTQLEKFGQTYWSSPHLFARDCVLWPPVKSGKSGLTEYQNNVLSMIPQNEKVCVRACHGAGKCLAVGEKLQLADGSLVPVEQLIGQDVSVVSFGASLNHLHVSKAIVCDNGVKDVVEIVTDKGRVIRRTLNHPLWADQTPYRREYRKSTRRLGPSGSWVEAGELETGAMIAVCLLNPGPRSSAMSDTQVKLAAYLLGDGSTGTFDVLFSQMEGVVLEEFKQCCADLGSEAVPSGTGSVRVRGADRAKWKPRGGILNPVRLLVREWGMDHKTAACKSFPSWVWNLDDRQLALFLSRLYACDGWAVNRAQANGKTGREIGFCVISPTLAADVHRALLRLGVQSRLRSKTTSCLYKGEVKRGVAYSVDIQDSENLLRFAKIIGIFGKTEAVEVVVQSCCSANSHYTQKWRKLGLPPGFAWERIKTVRVINDQPTVLVSVPGDQTFLTDFIEHNSMLCALSILWFALTRDALKADWKVVTTAGTNNQLKRYLWPEVRRWARLLDWEKIGRNPFSEKQELLEMSIKLQYGLAFAVSPDEPGNIEGAHADHLYYCYDESKLIVPQIWDAAEGAFSGAGEDTGRFAYALAISTPGAPLGRFYEIQNRTAGYEDWEPIHITLQEAMKAGRVTKDWVIKRRRQWGETSSIYQQKVLGNFASDDEDSVCPLTWVELANQRFAELFPDEDSKLAA